MSLYHIIYENDNMIITFTFVLYFVTLVQFLVMALYQDDFCTFFHCE